MSTACRLELAVDAGSFAPSVNEVRTLLEQDRVRQALDRAGVLADQYRSPQADLVFAWALWRNGNVREAEARFRRAAAAGLDGGRIGLAAVEASAGNWQGARELATAGISARDSSGPAHALLAAIAWQSGDRDTAVRELAQWSGTATGTARARAAEAMAAAAGELQGPLGAWIGEAAVVPLVTTASGALAVQVSVEGTPALLVIDLTFRQSLLSEELAAAAGLPVSGAATPAARAPSDRWPGILSPRQAACARLDIGTLSLRNVVLAVGEAPEGADGVIAMDVLRAVSWSLDPVTGSMSLAPPGIRTTSPPGAAPDANRTLAWLRTRLVYEGPTIQMLVFPRVRGEVVAAGLDVNAPSRLDSDLLPVTAGSGAAPTLLALGGWKGEVVWRPASLGGWALDGGVAPTAVLGSNLLGGWTMHWFPDAGQLRIDEPAPRGSLPRRPLQ